VAELNGSNLFMVKDGTVYTPYAHACLPGITRATVLELCQNNDVLIKEADLTLSQLYNADGVFATGTMGELTPVVEIDGREIGKKNALQLKVLDLFSKNIRSYCESLA
jgi:branched-chain amino acid aminotransferase